MMAKVKQMRPVHIPLVAGLAAGAIMLWSWFGSSDQPVGCYRIDKGTHIAFGDGKARLLGKYAGEARIMSIDRVRGWVVHLDRALWYDPALPSGTRFVQGSPKSRAASLFIDERFGEYPGILFHPEKGADVRFPEVACDTVAAG
jgi:hypothetical protein